MPDLRVGWDPMASMVVLVRRPRPGGAVQLVEAMSVSDAHRLLSDLQVTIAMGTDPDAALQLPGAASSADIDHTPLFDIHPEEP